MEEIDTSVNTFVIKEVSLEKVMRYTYRVNKRVNWCRLYFPSELLCLGMLS